MKSEEGDFKYNDEVEKILGVSRRDPKTRERSFLVRFKERNDGF